MKIHQPKYFTHKIHPPIMLQITNLQSRQSAKNTSYKSNISNNKINNKSILENNKIQSQNKQDSIQWIDKFSNRFQLRKKEKINDQNNLKKQQGPIISNKKISRNEEIGKRRGSLIENEKRSEQKPIVRRTLDLSYIGKEQRFKKQIQVNRTDLNELKQSTIEYEKIIQKEQNIKNKNCQKQNNKQEKIMDFDLQVSVIDIEEGQCSSSRTNPIKNSQQQITKQQQKNQIKVNLTNSNKISNPQISNLFNRKNTLLQQAKLLINKYHQQKKQQIIPKDNIQKGKIKKNSKLQINSIIIQNSIQKSIPLSVQSNIKQSNQSQKKNSSLSRIQRQSSLPKVLLNGVSIISQKNTQQKKNHQQIKKEAGERHEDLSIPSISVTKSSVFFKKNYDQIKKKCLNQKKQISISSITNNSFLTPDSILNQNKIESKIEKKIDNQVLLRIEQKFMQIYKELDSNKLGYINKQNCFCNKLNDQIRYLIGSILSKIKYQQKKYSKQQFIEYGKQILSGLQSHQINKILKSTILNRFINLETKRSQNYPSENSQNKLFLKINKNQNLPPEFQNSKNSLYQIKQNYQKNSLTSRSQQQQILNSVRINKQPYLRLISIQSNRSQQQQLHLQKSSDHDLEIPNKNPYLQISFINKSSRKSRENAEPTPLLQEKYIKKQKETKKEGKNNHIQLQFAELRKHLRKI